ncbi:MAG TPA: hypothetical protein VFJ91_07990 [Gaiellaceae bacterium]|nr:hypothetical protein [Gaiellaceae bacterium]
MRLLLAAAFLLAALAPAAASARGDLLAGHTIAGAGNVPLRRGWSVATAFVKIDFHAGPGHKLEFVDVGHGLHFRAVRFASATWGRRAVRFEGFGVADGRRVPFVATAIDGQAQDAFYVSWNHAAARGGPLRNGSITIGS